MHYARGGWGGGGGESCKGKVYYTGLFKTTICPQFQLVRTKIVTA